MKNILAKSILGLGVAVGALLVAPEDASAATGYPCTVTLLPYTGNAYYGNYGIVQIEMWSGAHCSGSFLGFVSAYSVGATNSTVNKSYLYTEAQLMALYRNMMEAASRSIRTYYFTASTSQYVLTYAGFNY